jgi:LysR family transcriptional regulator for metE and metH
MIEIKHLKTLQALRNCGSLAAAAATLHQTQSALSHQFSDLEQRLGFRLFVRKSQPLRFTPQGEILLQLANQVLPQIATALQSCNEPQQTTLRIAIECHSCIQWLTPALENFRQKWPQVEMDFKSGVTFDPQPSLQQGVWINWRAYSPPLVRKASSSASEIYYGRNIPAIYFQGL